MIGAVVSKLTNAVIGAVGVIGVAGAIISANNVATRAKPPKDAKHLWAKQPDGGTLLRNPTLLTIDGGCPLQAVRCNDNKCAGSCE